MTAGTFTFADYLARLIKDPTPALVVGAVLNDDAKTQSAPPAVAADFGEKAPRYAARCIATIENEAVWGLSYAAFCTEVILGCLNGVPAEDMGNRLLSLG